MGAVARPASLCSIAMLLVATWAAPGRAGTETAPQPPAQQGQAAAQAPGAGGPQGRGGGPPPSPATLKRARKVLLDAIVKEVATRRLGDCTVKQSIGAKIVSVERYDPNTRIWPVHATAVCTGPNSIQEVPPMTFNMTRDARGEWKAAYVKDDGVN